jgi:putative DNA primase/helicase
MNGAAATETGGETNLEAAITYAQRSGWRVFPIHWPVDGTCSCKNPDCQSPAKHPLTPNGFKDATTNPKIISEWWTKWPSANIGIATGAVSGIVVVDIDNRGEGGIRKDSAY